MATAGLGFLTCGELGLELSEVLSKYCPVVKMDWLGDCEGELTNPKSMLMFWTPATSFKNGMCQVP